jgi:prophage antirepressor-like protein
MNKEIQIFKNEKFGEVRLIEVNGRVMFVASDVAKALGYADPKQAVVMHCKSGEVLNYDTAYVPHSNGVGGTNVIVIGESNVYRLVMRSNLPKAEEFQDWVVEEVLPSIRKTGSYSVQPVSALEMFKTMVKCFEEQEQKIKQLETNFSDVNEKVKLLEEKTTNPKYFTIAQYCKLHKIEITYKQEAALGRKATKLSKDMGYPIGKVKHKYWEIINTYAEIVLDTLRKIEYDEVLFS